VWRNDFDVDTFFGGESEGVHDFAVADKIRGGDAERLGRAVDEIEIDIFGDGLVIDWGGAGTIDSDVAVVEEVGLYVGSFEGFRVVGFL